MMGPGGEEGGRAVGKETLPNSQVKQMVKARPTLVWMGMG